MKNAEKRKRRVHIIVKTSPNSPLLRYKVLIRFKIPVGILSSRMHDLTMAYFDQFHFATA